MDHKPGWMTLSEADRRLVGPWAADCAERVLPLFEAKLPPTPVRARQSRGSGPSRLGRSGLRDCAPVPGRLWQPRARSAIRLPQPPLAPRASQRQPPTCTQWRPPLTRRNTPLGLRCMRRGPASSRRSTTRALVTRRSDGRSSTPRRQFARLCGGCRFAALVAVGWTRSCTSSTQAFAADQRSAPPRNSPEPRQRPSGC